MSKETEIWNKVLSAAIQLPGVKVNRDSFLQEKLSVYCTGSQMSLAVEKGTIGILLSCICIVSEARLYLWVS